MWISDERFKALEGEIKTLREAIKSKADKDMGVGEQRVRYFPHSHYGYDHFITVEEAIRMLAKHLDVEFRASAAVPAAITLAKPSRLSEGLWFTGTVTTATLTDKPAKKKRKPK